MRNSRYLKITVIVGTYFEVIGKLNVHNLENLEDFIWSLRRKKGRWKMKQMI